MLKRKLPNKTFHLTNTFTFFALAVLVLVLAPLAALANPPQPQNITISGDETKPTVSWDQVEAEPNGVEWTEETGSAGWSARNNHAGLVFDNKLWILGGFDDSGDCNGSGISQCGDIWNTEDGITWTQVTASADWPARNFHTTAVFDNKMWIMGGHNGTNRINDVWYSEDGVDWVEATNNAQWLGRNDHTTVVFDNKLWVIGGRSDTTPRFNDVWHSEDGVNWTEATSEADWSARRIHSSVTFNGKIWVIGGHDGSGDCNGSGTSQCQDVWHSEDGVNWTEATSEADWSARSTHTSVVYDNKIWVIGGSDGTRKNDVWHSEDGVNWTEATSEADWSARSTHTSTVFDNRLWVMGGSDGIRLNDVWSTPNNTISHYLVCWDTTEGECGNSAKVNPNGDVVAQATINPSLFTKLKQSLLPSVYAQSNQLSYSLGEELDDGTWYFQVATVTLGGDQSAFSPTTAHTVITPPGLPDTGYGLNSNHLASLFLAFVGATAFAGGYYFKRRGIISIIKSACR